VDAWKDHFAEQGVSPADIESLAEHIDGDALLSQRIDFKPAIIAAPVKAIRRKSPFAP
jgi:serine/threonine-protein kinase HipA